MKLLKSFQIPDEYKKKGTYRYVKFFDSIDVYDDRVIGSIGGNPAMTWFFRHYTRIDFLPASFLNSQFAQIIFEAEKRKKHEHNTSGNVVVANDLYRIMLSAGAFKYDKTNEFARQILDEITAAHAAYKASLEDKDKKQEAGKDPVEEIKRYKELLDAGAITEEEYNAKKNQLLGLRPE